LRPECPGETIGVSRAEAADVGHDDQVPLSCSEIEVFFPRHQGVQVESQLAGSLSRLANSFLGWVKPRNYPALLRQEDAVSALTHPNVDCLTRAAGFNGTHQ
jgi:hypothetical protein